MALDFEDGTATFDAGNEGQVEANDTLVAEVPQTVDATEATATEAVGVDDTGAVGGDVDDGDDDSSSGGMPGWLWIVIAIVVIAIIAGVIFMVVRNKDD